MTKLYKNERKLSFMFFVLNSVLIFTYIRFSFIYSISIYISLIYYLIIFLGFHLFENTFTKRFYLRTKIILKAYYNKSQYIKIILWFLLVLTPSLLKYPLVIITVYQPLMLFLYLFEYDKMFLFFFIILLWCFLLFVLNKYKIGLNFLNHCKNYFSRRGCLHYIGNMFGACFNQAINNLNPWAVAGGIFVSLGVNYILTTIDFIMTLGESGSAAAKKAKDVYENSCKFHNIPPDK